MFVGNTGLAPSFFSDELQVTDYSMQFFVTNQVQLFYRVPTQIMSTMFVFFLEAKMKYWQKWRKRAANTVANVIFSFIYCAQRARMVWLWKNTMCRVPPQVLQVKPFHFSKYVATVVVVLQLNFFMWLVEYHLFGFRNYKIDCETWN